MSSEVENEVRVVEGTLRTWYDAMYAQDFDAVARALTDGFLMIENTELLDKSALLARLRMAAAYGRQTAELGDFHTRIHGDIAWTTLRNNEVWIPLKGEPKKINFVETVIFARYGGGWLIERYHATLIQPSP